MYVIYDLKDNEMCIGVFDTVKEVAKYFNTTTATIYCNITRKAKREGRYLIKNIDKK